jgi:hypothetical protein
VDVTVVLTLDGKNYDGKPLSGNIVPFSGNIVPLSRNIVPLSGNFVPLFGNIMPFSPVLGGT